MMIRSLTALAFTLLPLAVAAQDHQATNHAVIDEHILPAFETFANATEALKTAAQADCSARSPELLQAYHTGFDAWIAVSHLRFGPTEVEDRAFALAFWPDKKGFTPKSLTGLIKVQNPDGLDPQAFKHVSIAARGFFALEFMLYDEAIAALGAEAYQCALIQTIAADIDANSDAILAEWAGPFSQLMKTPSEDAIYRSESEVTQELFKSLVTGLQFSAEARLGRPLGTFERPRPRRAEARRSERSLRNVVVSLKATRDLAITLAREDEALAVTLGAAFGDSLALAERIKDPAFADLNDPQGRLKVEILQQSVNLLREQLNQTLGPHLGVGEGFNALDGD